MNPSIVVNIPPSSPHPPPVFMTPLLQLVTRHDDFLVVDKPAGLVCHPTKGDETSSLIGRVRLFLGHAEGRLVNRLDRETSGLVVVATTAEAAGALGKLFSGHAVRKSYLAIVHGHPSWDSRVIEAPIGPATGSAVAIKAGVVEVGAPALTEVVVVSRFEREGRPFAYVRVLPQTGRKHQIRIHLAWAGHPIVGDKIYGDDESRYLRFVVGAMTPEDVQALMLPNHALHADALAWPWGEAQVECVAPVPAMFQDFLPRPFMA